MAQTYQIPAFLGIDEGRSENTLESGYSPEAWNVDTEAGDLTVAKGFTKHIATGITGAYPLRMYIWRVSGSDIVVVVAGEKLLFWNTGVTPNAWTEIFDFSAYAHYGNLAVSEGEIDFMESRIGDKDYLIVSTGVMQLVKWDGTSNSAELFGSGEYVFGNGDTPVTITALTPAFPKATAVSYAESSNVATWTLTMPSGYVFAADGKIAFTVPNMVSGSVTSAKVNDGSNTYTLDYVPEWIGGDVAVVQTVSSTEAKILVDSWGYKDATLSSAIDSDWVTWAKGVGVLVGDTTYPISDIDNARTKVTFTEITDKLTVGDAVKIRGGVSDHPVSYIELYASRMFAAGDPNHPTRLYWSQPPGDVKTIESWAADDFSETASGGYMEIGPTSNDPIVGLTALPNQLIIHKETSNFRLIGTNPSDFQVLQINSGVERMNNAARIKHGDVPYWITQAGMYYYNGQQALLHPQARQVKKTLESANLRYAVGVECRNRLYFLINNSASDVRLNKQLLVFDMTENTWMLRKGFVLMDMAARDGEIYFLGYTPSSGYYVFKEGGTDYDGVEIDAYWRTPITDLGAKSVIKMPRVMYLRGRSGGVNDALTITEYTAAIKKESDVILPANDEEVKELTLHNQGRTFHYVFRNKAGSWFKILGGVEVVFEGKSYH